MRILVIAGSNRAGALSKTLAGVIAADFRDLDCDVDLLDLAELPADILLPTAYKEPSEPLAAQVQRFLDADGVLFVVPEYNGTFPGILKLYIDMLPYPAGLEGRPCSYVGLAAGQFQGLRAVEQLQGVTGYRNAYQHPRRTFIGGSFQQFTGEGQLADSELAERLQKQAADFVSFIGKVSVD